MGVLNCTPDSFSDGGLYLDERRALEHARGMVEHGASIIDVGAESTRPRAPKIDPAEQLARIGGVVRALSREGITVSIDTTSPEVAERAVSDGAAMINSVELGPTEDLAKVARAKGAALCLMHSRGPMSKMSDFSASDERVYGDVVADVKAELGAAKDIATSAGLDPEDVWLDPGLGFHKTARQSLELCTRLGELAALGSPILVGPSRKSFIAMVTTSPGRAPAGPSERLGGTIAACLLCARNGAAALRVHDIAEVRQAVAFEEVASHV